MSEHDSESRQLTFDDLFDHVRSTPDLRDSGPATYGYLRSEGVNREDARLAAFEAEDRARGIW